MANPTPRCICLCSLQHHIHSYPNPNRSTISGHSFSRPDISHPAIGELPPCRTYQEYRTVDLEAADDRRAKHIRMRLQTTLGPWVNDIGAPHVYVVFAQRHRRHLLGKLFKNVKAFCLFFVFFNILLYPQNTRFWLYPNPSETVLSLNLVPDNGTALRCVPKQSVELPQEYARHETVPINSFWRFTCPSMNSSPLPTYGH